MADFNQSPSGQALVTATITGLDLTLSEASAGAIDMASAGGTFLFPEYLNDLTDVVITSPAIGQKLQYNGSVWVNVTP